MSRRMQSNNTKASKYTSDIPGSEALNCIGKDCVGIILVVSLAPALGTTSKDL